jgi:hypothetical protein
MRIFVGPISNVRTQKHLVTMYPDNFLSQIKCPQKKTDYQPHEFDPCSDEDLLFYHVYDEQSQSPFRDGYGIFAGALQFFPKFKSYSQRITAASMFSHLDPLNRTPSSFISLYDTQDAAWEEGMRRIANPEVWNPRTSRWELRGKVFIAILSAASMSEAGVFYFSRRELLGKEMLGLRGMSKLARLVKCGEWFAMDHIPCSAMEGFLDLYFTGEECEACENWRC